MALPIGYSLRNVRVRWQVTVLATFGIALVVAVFSVLMSMSAGFARALQSTGREDNAMIAQRGSASEMTSAVSIANRNLILADERIARLEGGEALASPEQVVVIGLPKVTDGSLANITLRGVTPRAFDVRGGIRIVAGRAFTPGLDEVIVGRRISERIRGLEVGETVRHMTKRFTVVGHFESDGAAFESELWGDFDVLSAMFQRTGGSSVVVARLKDASQVAGLDQWIRAQPQMQLSAIQERKYYDEQAGPLATILKGLAVFVAAVMGLGAVFGAMNTMYAIVAARTREIGTLRALGFARGAIVLTFVIESVILASLGGAIGCALAFPMNGYSTGTGQTQSFSEIAFSFQITPEIVGAALAFAALMGFAGGLLPALRAARMPITAALRDA